MKQKRLIIVLISFLIPRLYAAGPHFNRDKDFKSLDSSNQTEENRAPKQHRNEDLSLTQKMAFYFRHLLKSNNMPLDRTYLHKFIYFANGLHYSLFNTPLLKDFSFDAHDYGPFVHDILPIYQREGLFNSATREDTMISDSDKSLCDFTFTALKHYRSGELSSFTHEKGTPWSTTRDIYKRDYGKKLIRPELDQTYFEKQEIIRRFFVEPVLHAPENFITSSEIATRLLEGEVITEMSKFKLALQENRFDDVRGLVEQLVDLSRRTCQFSLNLRGFQDSAFVSSLQTPMEGILSSLLFTKDFINNGELDLFYDEFFRTRVAISAGLKNMSSLYYLGQIFQTFSNNPNDEADQKAQDVQSRLESLANQIINKSALTTIDWQKSYDQSLAHFYLAKYDEAIKWMDNALEQVELPKRYRHDLLQRAFYITNDSKYIMQALSNRFQDFYIQKATTETSAEQAFKCYENAIMDRNLAEAYFKAGQMILQGNYTVLADSPLWNMMGINTSSGNTQLGTALLEKSIKSGVSEALTYYVESFLSDQDKEKKLAACDLAKGIPFAQHQKGELLESQLKLREARDAYISAGALLGYPDAMRLSSLEEQELLDKQRKEYKQRLLSELYEDYTNYVQEE